MKGLVLVFALAASLLGVSGASAQSTQYGLEWPGDGAQRRMLVWHNPFPMYDATYIFKVYPRKKTAQTDGYYTTFFWGNDGTFFWDGGQARNYYGAHPYPVPPPTGPGQWEISIYSNDYTTGNEIEWNRWHTQAFRAWRESPSITHHEFYYDLPDTSKVIRRTINDSNWGQKSPTTPSIHMGQAAWGYNPGFEEFNGIIRGIQMYSGVLSVADIQSEIAAPQSTAAGRNFIWYQNLDPRPSDVTDKKGVGTPHNPAWRGSTSLEWRGSGPPPPPSPDQPPTISEVRTTSVSTSGATIAWTTNEPADSQVEYGATTAYGQVTNVNPSLVTSHTMGLTGLASNTTYNYRVRSRDSAGNTTISGNSTFRTTTVADTTPPTIGAVQATNVTSSSATITWTTNEPADSQVEYGGTSSYGQTTTLDPSAVTAHSVALAALSPNTTYYFRVRSKDGAQNSSTSAGFTFTTTASVGGGGGGGSGAPTALAAYGFNEATGSTTEDASPSGFRGTLVNGPVWTSGNTGNAILFDGVDDRVTLPYTLDVSRLPFTLEAWIKPTSFAKWRGIFSKRATYTASQMRFDVGLTMNSGLVYVYTAQSWVTFNYAPPLNAWTHVAVVADASGTTLYVNGVRRQTIGAIVLGTRSDAPVAIGNTGDGEDPFAGVIDDLRLYNRAISESEIQSDMNTGLR